eukprot:RCo047254
MRPCSVLWWFSRGGLVRTRPRSSAFSSSSSCSLSLDFQRVPYGGVEITDSRLVPPAGKERTAVCGAEEAAAVVEALRRGLPQWKMEGYRAVWIKLWLPFSAALVSPALEMGFRPFYTTRDTLTLNISLLPKEQDHLPLGPVHHVGVACLAIDSEERAVVIRERAGFAKGFWKLPGGKVDPMEGVAEAAVREMAEEAGLVTRFAALCAIQEVHHNRLSGPARDGASDLYFTVLLHPPADPAECALKPQLSEVSAAEWMPVADLLKEPMYREGSGLRQALLAGISIHQGRTRGLSTVSLRTFRGFPHNVYLPVPSPS